MEKLEKKIENSKPSKRLFLFIFAIFVPMLITNFPGFTCKDPLTWRLYLLLFMSACIWGLIESLSNLHRNNEIELAKKCDQLEKEINELKAEK